MNRHYNATIKELFRLLKYKFKYEIKFRQQCFAPRRKGGHYVKRGGQYKTRERCKRKSKSTKKVLRADFKQVARSTACRICRKRKWTQLGLQTKNIVPEKGKNNHKDKDKCLRSRPWKDGLLAGGRRVARWPVGKKNDKSRPFLGQSHLHDDQDDDEVKHLKASVTSLEFSITKEKYHLR